MPDNELLGTLPNQPQLPDMPEAEAQPQEAVPTPHWRWMAEAAVEGFVHADVALMQAANVPGVPKEWVTIFDIARHRLQLLIRAEIGRDAYQESEVKVLSTWVAWRDAAVLLTKNAEEA